MSLRLGPSTSVSLAGAAGAEAPYPCSFPRCGAFHGSDSGFCQRHWARGACRNLCRSLREAKELLELGLLVLVQAAVEIESRALLVMLVLSVLPVACYSLAEATGRPALTVVFFLACFALAGLSVARTTSRLNRMQDTARQLAAGVEAVCCQSLRAVSADGASGGMSTLFGDVEVSRREELQPGGLSLAQHFAEAHERLPIFREELCVPLERFLQESSGASGLCESLAPKLKPLSQARAALAQLGDGRRLVDVLYCDVTFEDLRSMASAWHFLKARADSEPERGRPRRTTIRCVHDGLASAETGRRCAEILVDIDGYLATLRFLQASLARLEAQLDGVHGLADRLGLLAASAPRALRERQASRSGCFRFLMSAALAMLRASSLAVSAYLACQYLVRYSYSPWLLRSLPPVMQDALVVNASVSASESEVQESPEESEGHVIWWQGLVYAAPYAVLSLVLLCDLTVSYTHLRAHET